MHWPLIGVWNRSSVLEVWWNLGCDSIIVVLLVVLVFQHYNSLVDFVIQGLDPGSSLVSSIELVDSKVARMFV